MCMLPTYCPLTIWAISLEMFRKPSVLEADNFLGACYREAMTPKSYGLYFFPQLPVVLSFFIQILNTIGGSPALQVWLCDTEVSYQNASDPFA